MPFEKQVGIPGKIINAQAREIIANVLKFMKKEAANGSPIIPITSYKQRLLEATGVSGKTYRHICKEIELIDAGVINSFRTPVKCKRRKSAKNEISRDKEVKLGDETIIEEVIIKQEPFDISLQE